MVTNYYGFIIKYWDAEGEQEETATGIVIAGDMTEAKDKLLSIYCNGEEEEVFSITLHYLDVFSTKYPILDGDLIKDFLENA